MWARLAALAALVLASACATSQPKTFSGEFTHPPAHSRVLVMTPDIQLSLLTAAGLPEPREDWSRSGRDNIAEGLRLYVESRGHTQRALDPSTAMEGHVGQLIRLHDAVGQSIIAFNYLPTSLPTKRDRFEWTLGPGVQEMATTYEADYALFVVARGSYASSGRVAAAIGLAVLGVGVPLGGQQAFASLVDLHTGNIIWFNVVAAAPSEDMREADKGQALARRLMSTSPL